MLKGRDNVISYSGHLSFYVSGRAQQRGFWSHLRLSVIVCCWYLSGRVHQLFISLFSYKYMYTKAGVFVVLISGTSGCMFRLWALLILWHSSAAFALQGMEYLHQSCLKSHGRLRSSNCLVDKRWACRIADYGFGSLRKKSTTVDKNNQKSKPTHANVSSGG